jgi:hypothetical protein
MSEKREAKRFLREQIRLWKKEAVSLGEAVQAIEDPALRYAVAGTLDAVSSGAGAVQLKSIKGHVDLSGMALDDDVFDVMMGVLESAYDAADPVGVLQAGGDWLLDYWRERNPTIAHIAWLLGHVESDPDSEPIKDLLAAGRIVYSLPDRCVVGVLNAKNQLVLTGHKSQRKTLKFRQNRAMRKRLGSR